MLRNILRVTVVCFGKPYPTAARSGDRHAKKSSHYVSLSLVVGMLLICWMVKSEEIAQFLKKFADTFVSLGEYKMDLMQEMEETGVPMVRSLMLEFGQSQQIVDDQFMLGSKIMVAPVLQRGKT